MVANLLEQILIFAKFAFPPGNTVVAVVAGSGRRFGFAIKTNGILTFSIWLSTLL